MKTVKRGSGLLFIVFLVAVNALFTVRFVGVSYQPFSWAAFGLVYDPGGDPSSYDPTGCFYDIKTGKIIPGGLVIASDGPANITTALNGSNGCFQFLTDMSGTYALAVTLPPRCALASGCPDLGSYNPTNLDMLGPPPDDKNMPTMLTPFDPNNACTPWYTTIVLDDLGSGVTGNNIPLICEVSGAPALSWKGLAGMVALLLASGVISLRRQKWFGSSARH